MDDFQSDRIFRVWDWFVTHSQLLIRSVRDQEDPADKNIDLIFTGVSYVELPDVLRGLTVGIATREESRRVDARNGSDLAARCYAIESRGERFLVRAASLQIVENELPMLRSSLDREPTW